MTTSGRIWSWKLWLASWLVISGAIASRERALAQITPDTTLGSENSTVTSTGAVDSINGGATRGANLFHSFQEFSIDEGRAAVFTNPAGIENILTRVTGANPSNIFGTLGVAGGNANLFLINPNGIIFGSNARLDVGGSFVGTTASSLNFADGTEFSAKAPQSTPLLTVSVPLGLQFGTDSGKISVQGPGNSLSLDPQINASGTVIGTIFNRSTRPVGLQVQPDKTLALVGGDVMLEGGNLTATSGRIELGSIAGPHFVSLNPMDKGWALGYQGVQNFGIIQMSQAASVDVSGTGSGDIQVRGRRITLTDGSVIAASTLGAKPGGTLTLAADDAVELTGTNSNYQISSSLFTETVSSGSAGDITIYTDKLIVRDGAQVTSTSISGGAAGKLNVTAPKSVELVATGNVAVNAVGSFEIPSALGSVTTGTGRAEDITIATNKLSAISGAQIQALTFGTGSAGNLVVKAYESVELIGTTPNGPGSSGLSTSAQPGATGSSGNLTLETGRLSVRDGAQIQAATFGTGSAGNLVVKAYESVELIGTRPNGQASSSLSASAQPNSTGDAGDLSIKTNTFLVKDGAFVSASTLGAGKGGNLTIDAQDMQIIGTSANGPNTSGLFASAQPNSTGDAGDLSIKTNTFLVRDGAQVGVPTLGAGKGGNLTVDAQDVQIIGTSANRPTASGLFASAQPNSTGDAGDLTIETNTLLVQDGAVVSVGSIGTGTAGNMTLNARSIRLDNNALFSANTRSATVDPNSEQATININSQNLIMRRGSTIRTNATGDNIIGGNININSDIIAALENSDISANSANFRGGNVRINTSAIFGTQFRDVASDRTSDITATGASPEFSGNVELDTPDTDLNSGLVNLPTVPIETEVAQACTPSGSQANSEFVVTGRGGLPPNPTEALSSDAIQIDWVTLNPDLKNQSSPADVSTDKTNPTPVPIVEAQGWMTDNNGNIVLTATPATATSHIPWLTTANCQTTKTQS